MSAAENTPGDRRKVPTIEELRSDERYEGIEIISINEGGEVVAYITPDRLYTGDVATNPDHTLYLADLMDKEVQKVRELVGEESLGEYNGQTDPINIAMVDSPEYIDPETGKLLLPVYNGFHRGEVFKLGLVRTDRIFVTIKPNVSPDELIALRVINSSDELRSARLPDWVNSAWEASEWAQSDLHPRQAFALANNKTSGARLGLTPEEARKLKEWAYIKGEQWKTPVLNIWLRLRAAAVVDPDIIKASRPRAGGSKLIDLTDQHVNILADQIPAEELPVEEIDKEKLAKIEERRQQSFELQQLVRKVIIREKLTNDHARGLILELKARIDYSSENGYDLEAAERLTKDKEFLAKINPKLGMKGSKRRKPVNIKYERYAAVVQTLRASEIALGFYALKAKVTGGEYVSARLDTQENAPVEILPDSLVLPEYIPTQWDDESVEWLTEQLDKIARRLKPSLTTLGPKLSDEKADELFDRVKFRIIKDARGGALRFVPTKNERIIADLFMGCLKDERAPKATKSSHRTQQPEAVTVVVEDSELDDFYANRLDASERLIFIYRALFNLTTPEIAHITGLEPKAVEESLQDMAKL